MNYLFFALLCSVLWWLVLVQNCLEIYLLWTRATYTYVEYSTSTFWTRVTIIYDTPLKHQDLFLSQNNDIDTEAVTDDMVQEIESQARKQQARYGKRQSNTAKPALVSQNVVTKQQVLGDDAVARTCTDQHR